MSSDSSIHGWQQDLIEPVNCLLLLPRVPGMGLLMQEHVLHCAGTSSLTHAYPHADRSTPGRTFQIRMIICPSSTRPVPSGLSLPDLRNSYQKS